MITSEVLFVLELGVPSWSYL